jgi:citrate lyase subunit beta/citryl-CoA lyase
MPGSNARAIEKARELPADGVILDLEDAVAPDAKAQARELVVQALQKGGFGGREVLVRINGLDTAWWRDDLAVAAAGPDALLLPKVSTPEQLRELARHFVGVGAEARIRVWAMMETPLAMLNARDIAAAALDPATRLAGFVMGTNDLAKETRARIVPGRAPASRRRAPTASPSSTASITNSATWRVSPRSAGRRAISVSTARR